MSKPVVHILTMDRLKIALEQDMKSQNLRMDLQMAFLRRGLAEMPPPPPLQRARRYYPNLQTDVRNLRDIIWNYPRLNTLLTNWIEVAKHLPVYLLIAEMKELCNFLKVAPSIAGRFPTFWEGGHEVAVIYLLRTLTATMHHKRIHAAIRQAIISPEHNFLHAYGLYAAGQIADAQQHDDPIPSCITNPAGETVLPLYNYDMQLGVAMALLHEFMETLVPEYAPLCRAVRIGQTMLRRAPLILHKFKRWNCTNIPTLEGWYGFCQHARSLEEMREIIETTGLEIGPGS